MFPKIARDIKAKQSDKTILQWRHLFLLVLMKKWWKFINDWWVWASCWWYRYSAGQFLPCAAGFGHLFKICRISASSPSVWPTTPTSKTQTQLSLVSHQRKDPFYSRITAYLYGSSRSPSFFARRGSPLLVASRFKWWEHCLSSCVFLASWLPSTWSFQDTTVRQFLGLQLWSPRNQSFHLLALLSWTFCSYLDLRWS